MKPVVAVFDFDGTLTYRDTLLPFLVHAYGPCTTSCKLTIELPYVLGFTLGIVPRQRAKERVLKRFFEGMQLHEIETLGHSFAHKSLDKHLRPEGKQRIAWHLSQGHRCILVSASLDVYLKPWAEKMGFHDTITSRFEVTDQGTVTGKLLGLNCWGPEKVRRIVELIGPPEDYQLYAYGDSRGDQEMLALADHPYYRTMPAQGADS